MTDEIFLAYVIPVIFLLCGSGLLIGGSISVARTRKFLTNSVEAKGEVVALEVEPPTELGESETYRPVVLFGLNSGQQIKFKSMVHSNPPAYEVGETVTVLYHRNQPHEARIRSFASLWLLASILSGLGVIFTVVGIGLLVGSIPL